MNTRLCWVTAISAALSGITLHAEAPFNFESTPGKLPKDVVWLELDVVTLGHAHVIPSRERGPAYQLGARRDAPSLTLKS